MLGSAAILPNLALAAWYLYLQEEDRGAWPKVGIVKRDALDSNAWKYKHIFPSCLTRERTGGVEMHSHWWVAFFLGPSGSWSSTFLACRLLQRIRLSLLYFMHAWKVCGYMSVCMLEISEFSKSTSKLTIILPFLGTVTNTLHGRTNQIVWANALYFIV